MKKTPSITKVTIKGALFLAIILLIMAGCSSSAPAQTANRGNTSGSTSSVRHFNPSWAELRVSNNANVVSINGQRVNWQPGFITDVPAGRNTIEARMSGITGGNTVTMTANFTAGNSYMIEYQSEDITTEQRANYRITTYSGNFIIREYGASTFVVPGRNESVVEFTLTGSYTRLIVNGYHYRLSSYSEHAASKLMLVLPAGKHRISSLASAGEIELDLAPNRYVSFNVNTQEANIVQTKNDPLNHLGRWGISVDWDSHIVLTLSVEGRGTMEMYINDVLQEGSGMFFYRITDTNIIITSETPTITMRYSLTPDMNSMSVSNFWGSQQTLTGIRF